MQKVVLITGVSGGIGLGLAKAFKQANYFVVGLDMINTENSSADKFILFDLHEYCSNEVYRNEQEILLQKEVPELDVLVNNAAVQLLGSMPNISLKDWNKTLNVNLTAPLLLSQLFLNRLEKNKGCIINIGSIHQQQTKKKFVAYATSKSAIIGLTKSMSVDLQGKVRVNAISPAAIDTQMLRDGFNNDENKVQQLNELHPLQRIGQPAEVAELALFLASDKCGFINGANIQIDGGISNALKDLE